MFISCNCENCEMWLWGSAFFDTEKLSGSFLLFSLNTLESYFIVETEVVILIESDTFHVLHCKAAWLKSYLYKVLYINVTWLPHCRCCANIHIAIIWCFLNCCFLTVIIFSVYFVIERKRLLRFFSFSWALWKW